MPRICFLHGLQGEVYAAGAGYNTYASLNAFNAISLSSCFAVWGPPITGIHAL